MSERSLISYRLWRRRQGQFPRTVGRVCYYCYFIRKADFAERAKVLRRGLKVLFASRFPDIRSGGCPQPGMLPSKPYRSQELAQKLYGALQFEP